MFTSENIATFAERLAEHRPEQIFSIMGTHNVEYVEGDEGTVAVIETSLPEGMNVILGTGGQGPLKAVVIRLPEAE